MKEKLEDRRAFDIQDSNYLVLMSSKEEYVIERWQFEKLLTMLNEDKVQFVTINNIVVNKRYIKLIEPTGKQTPAQKKRGGRVFLEGTGWVEKWKG